MTPLLFAIANWLHALASVIFIGHYGLLALIYLPVLTKERANNVGLVMLSEISKHSRGWLYAALGLFTITGIYLMLVDTHYFGLGNFSNPWSLLMLIKHVVIAVMVGLGFWYNAILRVGPRLSSNTSAASAINSFRQHTYWMASLGAIVLLLTAISQTY